MEKHVHLALGDSITVGYEASQPSQTYIYHVSQAIRQRGLADETRLIAKNGWDSSQLVRALHTIPPAFWSNVSIATLLIGGNDLRSLLKRLWTPGPNPLSKPMIDMQVSYFERNYHVIAKALAEQVPTTVAMTIYNPVPNFPVAQMTFSQMNGIIRDAANKYQFPLVDLHTAFSGRESQYIHRYQRGILEDLMRPFLRPIHPNDAGHAVIAERVIACLPKTLDAPGKVSPSVDSPSKHQQAEYTPRVRRRGQT
ncbi:SGNH/GDSL hydrolase family protein [Alicyclobacillus dauci]|uniref:SGNH/GDSL hydrolase family protein n=1 Tax=Alicyclobacillus dauci TaxID=1475485 RepID=A0ABY6Z4R4_9BACL|nr:SGNH/GDSL hydrolase family protein [Alicyclobacillus dauci]WAH37648.1 SGNH/GDSL hydrolase family protein [Alicyclobacillus dauci]